MTLVELLRARGIPFRSSPYNPEEITLCCVFCLDKGQNLDTKFRLAINTAKRMGLCFNCGWKSGHAIGALLQRLGVIQELESVEGAYVKPKPAPKPDLPRLPIDFQVLTEVYDDFDRMALGYLTTRGITQSQIEQYRIGVSYVGRYAFRIVFPVYVQGKLAGMVARDFVGREPRYLNSPGLKALYNLPNRAVKEVILCEGIFKALRLEQTLDGKRNTACVAVLGHSFTDEQMAQLEKSKPSQITIFPDPDSVGQRGALKIADKLIQCLGIRASIVPWTGKAADELPLPELRTALCSAQGLTRSVQQRMLLRASGK